MKRALLDLIQTLLESVGAFPHWAKAKKPIEADGNLSFGFYGVIWSQTSCFTKHTPGLVSVPIAAICQPS